MKVQVRIEVLFVKGFDRLRLWRCDVAVPHVLSHHRSVLCFRQPIIIGVPRPRFGLFDQQFVQQPGHGVIDKLAAVVGMEAQNAKRELRQHRFQHRQQVSFTDLRRSAHYLPLRDLIHGVDVVDPFDSVQIPLVHGVHSQIARPAVWFRTPPLANGHRCGPSRLIRHPPLSVGPALPQPIQLRHRQSCQPFIAQLVEIVVGPLQNLLRRRPAQCLVGFVHLGQQLNILPLVPLPEAVPSIRFRLHFFSPYVHSQQPRRLCAA